MRSRCFNFPLPLRAYIQSFRTMRRNSWRDSGSALSVTICYLSDPLQAVEDDVTKLDPNKLFVLPHGESDGTKPLIFSSVRFLKHYIRAKTAFGKDATPCALDATYKIMWENWILPVLGINSLREDHGVLRTTFRPFVMGLMKSEAGVRPVY